MANIKSKIKNIKKIKKANLRNKMVKSKVKTAIKKAKIAINQKEVNTKNLISLAQKELDTAISKGVLHKNTARRKTSRLMKFYNKTNISSPK